MNSITNKSYLYLYNDEKLVKRTENIVRLHNSSEYHLIGETTIGLFRSVSDHQNVPAALSECSREF